MPPSLDHPARLDHRALRGRLMALGVVLAALLALALAWQFTPLKAWLDPLRLVGTARAVAGQLGWMGALTVFTLACCAAVPLSLLMLLAVLAFEPLTGALLGLAGASISGALVFAAGRWLGQTAVEQLAGARLRALNDLVARRGFVAVIAARLVPAAPYSVVNMVLGASRLRFGTFLLANLIGVLPMALITALLAPQILAQLLRPTALGWTAALIAVLIVVLASWWIKRWVARL